MKPGFISISLGDPKYFELIKGERVTKNQIVKNPGRIPVISGHKKLDSYLGHVSEEWLRKNNIPIYTEKLITINSNGHVGGVFLRQLPKFTFHDDVTGIRVKNSLLVYEYIIFAIKNSLVDKGFSWSYKLYKNNLTKISISIPTDKNGLFDVDKQNDLASKYATVEEHKRELATLYEGFSILKVDLSQKGLDYINIKLGNNEYFEVDNGERIRKVDINKAPGAIPVYSASKYEREALGYVSDKIKEIVPKAKKFDGKTLTINADGSVGKVFLRCGEFYANDIVNVVKILNPYIVQEYMRYELEREIATQGFNAWSNKLYKQKLRNITIRIPLLKNGKLDIDKQKEIAEKYRAINKINEGIANELRRLSSNSISI